MSPDDVRRRLELSARIARISAGNYNTRRWAFYEIGAMMCDVDTRKEHGPARPTVADVAALYPPLLRVAR